MAWERRGTHLYYYRGTRRHGGVTKEYLGTGPCADLCAAEDAVWQAQRRAAAETWRQEQAVFKALDSQITTWWYAGTTAIKATLYAAGYYQHDRGEWRKRATD
jgi:hypothetical protein